MSQVFDQRQILSPGAVCRTCRTVSRIISPISELFPSKALGRLLQSIYTLSDFFGEKISRHARLIIFHNSIRYYSTCLGHKPEGIRSGEEEAHPMDVF